jgi:hypothetical protein
MKVKKSLSMILALLFLMVPTFAEKKVVLSSRVDYTSSDNDTTKSNVPNSQGFELHSAKLIFSGDVNKKADYFMKLENNTSIGNKDVVSNDTDFISELNISIKHTNKFSTKYGKQSLPYGGFEYDHDVRDLFIYSLAGGSVSYNQVGMSGTYKIGDSSLKFHIANADRDTDVNGNASQKNVRYGLVWFGNYGMFSTIAAYSMTPKADGVSDSDITVGVRVKQDNWYIEADYLSLVTENASPTKDTENNSIVARAGMTFGSLTPNIKFFSDEHTEDTTANNYDRTGYSFSLFCEDSSHKNIRYHIAYTSVDKDFKDASMQDTTSTKIYAGLKFDADLF